MERVVVCVTGATGFVGGHIAVELLKSAPFHWVVRACVRCSADDAKLSFLRAAEQEREQKEGRAAACARLEIARFDIDDDNNEQQDRDAFRDAAIVVHAAAKVAFESSQADTEIVQPSLRGTQRVLMHLDRSTTRLLLFLSSIAAVRSFDQPDTHVFTEADWNSWSTLANGDAYGYAKTAAERMVRDFAQAELQKQQQHRGHVPLQVVSVNPGVCLGPALAKAHTKASPLIVRQMLFANSLVADQQLAVVDARDVARFVRMVAERALAGPSATYVDYQRFVLVCDNLLLSELAALLHNCADLAQYDVRAVFDHPFKLWCKSWLMSPFWRESFARRCVLDGSHAVSEFRQAESASGVEVDTGFSYTDIRDSLRDTALTMIREFGITPRAKATAAS
ncbi:Dihydroflavonol 4-reductase [Porphyridium purpureum]|uniref:Dihydroflavonol 4-reductase n=1 Tax=Porphyridium purpureum TaxID=35688 RepID=A0A5J4YN50_PORPP|nr:Dihydroflavonol 4-reductase [Porphyridium purpureum]|eukprot:POR0741..scf249_10